MKDITSTPFGYLIAFLLPGLAGLYAASFWSARIYGLFGTFLTKETNTAAFVMVLLASVAVGVMLDVPRELLFERLICRGQSLDSANLPLIGKRLVAFRAVVDELYRYHQFWGDLVFVVPVMGVGWERQIWHLSSPCDLIGLGVLMLALEVISVIGAVFNYGTYVFTANRILREVQE